MPEYDVIIIGSGLAGIHAAFPLVESGLKVAMVDVGLDESADLDRGKGLSFDEERKFDPIQHEIFLGKDLSGIDMPNDPSGHSGNMTSGRRSYITRSTNDHSPIESSEAVVLQSLAKGGLSEAWGAVCGFFNSGECAAAGLPHEAISYSYGEVIRRIGVSGPSRDGYAIQPEAKIDDNARSVLAAYRKKKKAFERLGFTLEQPPLAILTADLGSRRKTSYRDMDFWDNIGRSVYRGHFSIEELQRHANFRYIDGCLVSRVSEDNKGCQVSAKRISTGETILSRSRSVVVAAGALNTTRLLLRSLNLFDVAVPILLKNNYIIPSLLWKRIGRAPTGLNHSLCQLTMHDTKRENEMTRSYVQLYSYKSLLLHKLLKYVPLPKPEALLLLSAVVPSMMLADIRFPSVFHEERRVMLKAGKDGPDYLHINCPFSKKDKEHQEALIGHIKKALFRLGLIPMKTVPNAFGATVHYAGGAAAGEPGSSPLATDGFGKLRASKSIYIADSATWKALPAKPPALTIMANANRIARHLRDVLGVI